MKIYKLILVVFCIFCMQGCSNETITYSEITPDKAYEMIENNKEIVIVDVREQDEYETGHLIDSINVPLGTIDKSINKFISDKETPIIVYCKSGARALEASQILVDKGYTNVYTFGGIDSWEYEITEK